MPSTLSHMHSGVRCGYQTPKFPLRRHVHSPRFKIFCLDQCTTFPRPIFLSSDVIESTGLFAVPVYLGGLGFVMGPDACTHRVPHTQYETRYYFAAITSLSDFQAFSKRDKLAHRTKFGIWWNRIRATAKMNGEHMANTMATLHELAFNDICPAKDVFALRIKAILVRAGLYSKFTIRRLDPWHSSLSVLYHYYLIWNIAMECKYQALSPIPEKRRGESFESSSTLGDLDHLELPLKSVKSSRFCGTYQVPGGLPSSRWLWLIHGVLLMTSCTLFALAMTVRSSTLEHVRRFSAWCKWS